MSLSPRALVLVTRPVCLLTCLVAQAILKLGITILPQLPEQWNYKGALSHLVFIHKLLFFFLRQDLIYPRLASASQRIILSFWLHPSSADITGVCYHACFIQCLGSNPRFQSWSAIHLQTELHPQPHKILDAWSIHSLLVWPHFPVTPLISLLIIFQEYYFTTNILPFLLCMPWV